MPPYWKTCFKAVDVVDKVSVNRVSNIALFQKKTSFLSEPSFFVRLELSSCHVNYLDP